MTKAQKQVLYGQIRLWRAEADKAMEGVELVESDATWSKLIERANVFRQCANELEALYGPEPR